jgi:hypothetical protein
MRLEGIVADVIQAPKLEPRIMRYELSDYEWTAIKPMLPNKPRGIRGSVAKTIAEDGRTGINSIRSPLCGGIEKSGNEDRLSSDIASADLSNLPLPDHRHRSPT